MKQTVRIIGGSYRGKKIHFPDLPNLRPTTDRIKETLFNWLMHDIRGARCLDAYAGSGALGFEAFSRGAKRVVMVESFPQIYRNLRKIAEDFHSEVLSVVHAEAEDYFKSCNEQFDLVFLDPPFAMNYLPKCLDFLSQSKLLVEGGLVYIETASRISLDSSIWCEKKLKQAGQVHYGLYEKRITNHSS